MYIPPPGHLGGAPLTVIQWFPGHMQKTRREIRESLRAVDIVLEVVDARVPSGSANPDLALLSAGKPRVVLLNKADLADPEATRHWVEALRAAGTCAVPVSATSERGTAGVLAAVQSLFAPALSAIQARGFMPRPARVMVVGMPNTGKSTVINRLAGRNRTRTGAQPGVTRGRQWVRVGGKVDLLDMPGVLVPKFLDQGVAVHLAALGFIKDDVYDVEAVAAQILVEIWQLRSDELRARWQLTAVTGNVSTDLAALARGRGLVGAGGEPDSLRAAHGLLKDLRSGRLGRLTFEWPDGYPMRAGCP